MPQKIVKCISCTAVSLVDANSLECSSCDDSDLYAEIVGQSVNLCPLDATEIVDEWCQENSWNDLKVVAANHNAGVLWIEDFSYPIKVEYIA